MHQAAQSIGASTSAISPSNSGLISFRIDWLDLLAVQGLLKSLLQHHSSKTSILQHSAFFMIQLPHPFYIGTDGLYKGFSNFGVSQFSHIKQLSRTLHSLFCDILEFMAIEVKAEIRLKYLLVHQKLQ